MRRCMLTAEQTKAVALVFGEYRQVLVELNFPGIPISPDYHLLDNEDDLMALLAEQKPPLEVRLIPATEIGRTDGEAFFRIG
jgi:hypothetical protein